MVHHRNATSRRTVLRFGLGLLAAPVLAAADAEILGVQTDAVLLVVRAGQTDRHSAQYAVQQLRAREGAVLPQHLARREVDGRDERRPEVAARADDARSHANRRADVDAHP